MKLYLPSTLLLFWSILFPLTSCGPQNSSFGPTITLTFTEEVQKEAIDGRLILLFSTDDSTEPRFQLKNGFESQQVFGMNVSEMKAGESITFDRGSFGFPINKMADLPAGEYFVQAVLHKYETFNLSTGHSVKLPMDQGEGQQWNRSPGNLYSTVKKISIKPKSSGTINISLDQVIPPIPEPEDSQYIRHIKIRSELLSEFWGRDMYLGAHVLIPEGFDEHPEARFPLAIFHGHFPYDFSGFRTEPPDPDLEPDYSERFGVEGYNILQQQEAYDFYKQWIHEDFPRMLIVEIQHPNPYYDDSYAVNSANLGPYGDAITYELIPYIEEQFQGIGEGWARFLYGGSTGGWEALAAQVFYPDEYNGCFAACPDPIDFRAFCLTNIYEDKNAYWREAPFQKIPIPGLRNYLGEVSAFLHDLNYKELALGDQGRSGDQWDIWQAVYSPMGEDGYPKPIWDKKSGEIDPEVAAHWKEHYDLRYILERDWESLGKKLEGKIHIYCGDMDNYYLNNAVYLMEEFLEGTEDPYYNGEVAYGDRFEHCWNGDPDLPNHITRLRYNTMYVPKILDRIAASAPEGADLSSWRY